MPRYSPDSAVNAMRISSGYYHNAAVTNIGELWAWGFNELGQVGTGQSGLNLIQSTPVAIKLMNEVKRNWTFVGCGAAHTLAINGKGELYVFGSNSNGQLALGTGVFIVTEPGPLSGSVGNWVMCSAGERHSAAINAGGGLFVWGDNTYGQIGNGAGNGTFARVNTPTSIGQGNWVSVACGHDFTLAINSKGELYGWGNAASGQLGPGITGIAPSPRRIGSTTDWLHVSCGEKHTAAIDKNGYLYTWGNNASGQLGDNTTVSKSTLTQILLPVESPAAGAWKHVSCGKAYTAAITGSGSIYLWGSNTSGQLGDGSNQSKSRPTKITTLKNCRAVSCGVEHTIATNVAPAPAERCFAWGSNFYGELGNGQASMTGSANKNRPTLVSPSNLTLVSTLTRLSCGSNFSVGITSDGQVIGWGGLTRNAVGAGVYGSIPAVVDPAATAKAVFAGGGSAGILTSANILNTYNSGLNFTNYVAHAAVGGGSWAATTIDGHLLYSGDIIAPDLEVLRDWRFVSVSRIGPGEGINYEPNLAAINVNGELYIQGYTNGFGQLGHSNQAVGSNPPVGRVQGGPWVSVSLGNNHAAAINGAGDLYTWGDNSRGQLGVEDPKILKKSLTIRKVEVDGVGVSWVKVCCGLDFTVGLTSSGAVYTWGYDSCGQIGDGIWKAGVTPRTIFKPSVVTSGVDIAAGDQHVVCLRA
jgi:alpha-tubulin suppressor-like RCC1 family protein